MIMLEPMDLEVLNNFLIQHKDIVHLLLIYGIFKFIKVFRNYNYNLYLRKSSILRRN